MSRLFPRMPTISFTVALLANMLIGAICGSAWAADLSAQSAFKRLRPSVVEIRVEVKGNRGTSAGASGFVAFRPDLVVTNYHAVTEALYEPEQHRISVVTAGTEQIEARILALDVVNDLALLQLEKPPGLPLLPLRSSRPARGEIGFSMGKPGGFEVGIVTGTFNGVMNDDPKTLLVFSGAINRGMSGGPMVDVQGQVVGVNVATSTRHQLVGLAVPAEALLKLYKGIDGGLPPGQQNLLKQVVSQAALFGQQQIRTIESSPTPERTLGPFTVRGDLNKDNPCRTEHSADASRPYVELEQVCNAGVGVSLMPGRSAGRINSESVWLSSTSLSNWQMSSLLERRLNSTRELPESQRGLPAWKCRQQSMQTPESLPLLVHACRRPVKHLPGLHDYRFRYVSKVQGPDALLVSLDLTGMDEKTAQAALLVFMKSSRWQPVTKAAP
jgi:serine protease Do